MTTHILLAEDNAELAGSLADYLSEVGFEMDFAFNGESCIELVKKNHYDVIIMDIMMPLLNGLSACQMLREEHCVDTPIIFLTARDSLEDKLEGFAAGGDDFLVKPFSPEELVCRLKALLKRKRTPNQNLQIHGEITIDHQLQQIFRQDQLIEVYETQFKLLILLAQASPKPVSRLELENSLWPEGLPDSDPLRTHIYRLRLQLDKPFKKNLIKTVHGKGYRLAVPY